MSDSHEAKSNEILIERLDPVAIVALGRGAERHWTIEFIIGEGTEVAFHAHERSADLREALLAALYRRGGPLPEGSR